MVVYPGIHVFSFLNTRASRAPDVPPIAGHAACYTPLSSRRSRTAQGGVRGGWSNEPKLARPAAQARRGAPPNGAAPHPVPHCGTDTRKRAPPPTDVLLVCKSYSQCLP